MTFTEASIMFLEIMFLVLEESLKAIDLIKSPKLKV